MAKGIEVFGAGGLRGTIDNPDQLDDPRVMSIPIRLESGREVWAPAHLLQRQPDGSVIIDSRLNDVYAPPGSVESGATQAGADVERPGGVAAGQTTEQTRVPVIEEQLEIGKRTVETGVVHINKSVEEREEMVDEPLFREEVKIERVAVNRAVDGPQEIRQEGDTTIVPLLEEVLVVEKRLMLKEELYITRVRWERHEQQRVPVRREEVRIERNNVDDQGVTNG